MIELQGKFCKDCKIFTDNVEQEAIQTIYSLINSPEFKDSKVRCMPDTHQGKGIVIGFTSPAGKYVNPDHVGCLDCDTEILTPSGWIKISDYIDQEILQYDPENNTSKFALPKLYIKKPCKEFYHFYNKDSTLDQVVSEEHKMLVFIGRGKYLKYKSMNPITLSSMKSIHKGHYRYKTSFISSEKGIEIPDELIRVDIMVQADGQVIPWKDGSRNTVHLHIIKDRKIKRAKELLNAAGIKFTEYNNTNGSTTIKFHVPTYINKNLTKYYRANYNQLKIVAEECLLWDGHKGYRSYYSSTNRANSDVIQFAFSAIDVRASISLPPHKDTHSQCYVVTPARNNFVCYGRYPEKIPAKDGLKYCFTTDTGYFICRRNNNIFITGNCDIGCSVSSVFFSEPLQEEQYALFEHRIKLSVPQGMRIHEQRQFDVKEFLRFLRTELQKAYQSSKGLTYIPEFNNERDLEEWLRDVKMDAATFYKSIGTLGGGEVI